MRWSEMWCGVKFVKGENWNMEWKIMLNDCKTEPALIPANNMTHSKIVVVLLLLLYKDDTKCKQESFLKHAHKRKSGKTLYTQKSNVIKELGAAFQTLLLTFSLFSINIVNTTVFFIAKLTLTFLWRRYEIHTPEDLSICLLFFKVRYSIVRSSLQVCFFFVIYQRFQLFRLFGVFFAFTT